MNLCTHNCRHVCFKDDCANETMFIQELTQIGPYALEIYECIEYGEMLNEVIRFKKWELVRLLLDKGAKIENLYTLDGGIHKRDVRLRHNTLSIAIGHAVPMDIFQRLLENDGLQSTFLSSAGAALFLREVITFIQPEYFNELVRRGITLHETDNNGFSSMHIQTQYLNFRRTTDHLIFETHLLSAPFSGHFDPSAHRDVFLS